MATVAKDAFAAALAMLAIPLVVLALDLALGGGGLLASKALVVAAFSVVPLVLACLAPLVVGRDRKRLALGFGPTVRLIVITAGISLCLQTGLLVFTAYVVEATLFHVVHVQILALVGLAGLAFAVFTIMATFSAFRQPPEIVAGRRLDSRQAPALFETLGGLASRVGAAFPDNVVVGLEPGFFVTSAAVRLIEDPRPLGGTTLYASLPLCRLLTQDELAAVASHELAHFSGDDTLYSLRFAPTYRLLLYTIGAMSGRSWLDVVITRPTRAVLTFSLAQFASSERRIGRQRELRADEIGAAIAGRLAMATALLKLNLYAPLWPRLGGEVIKAEFQNTEIGNLSAAFLRIAAEYAASDMAAKVAKAAGSAMTHPTDTHPTTSDRLRALQVDLASIPLEQLRPAPTDPAALSGASLFEIELTLSKVSQRLLAESWRASQRAHAAARGGARR